jgi:hypothetical protein
MQSSSDQLSLKFSSLLDVFHGIIKGDPSADKVKKALAELKETAKNSPELNGRQVEAIVARCDNYIKGEYGKSKKPENYGHTKVSSNGVSK